MATDETAAALLALRLRCSFYAMCEAGDALVGSSRAIRARAEVCEAIDRAKACGATTAAIEVVMRDEGLLSPNPSPKAVA